MKEKPSAPPCSTIATHEYLVSASPNTSQAQRDTNEKDAFAMVKVKTSMEKPATHSMLLEHRLA